MIKFILIAETYTHGYSYVEETFNVIEISRASAIFIVSPIFNPLQLFEIKVISKAGNEISPSRGYRFDDIICLIDENDRLHLDYVSELQARKGYQHERDLLRHRPKGHKRLRTTDVNEYSIATNAWFPYLTTGAGDKPQHNYWGTFP